MSHPNGIFDLDQKSVKKPSLFSRAFKAVKNFVILFFISSFLQVLILKFVPPFITPLMMMRSVEQVANGKLPSFSYRWKGYDQISDPAKLAVIASEDQNFSNHFGIDFKEMKKAYLSSKKNGKKKIRGASTITQQVAKNVFLVPARSFVRKGLELYYAVLIEIIWGKKRILTTYLNVAEMGQGIYGVGAASKHYFKKDSDSISKREASAIAAILPNPRKYSVNNPSSYILKRQRWIRTQMSNLGTKYFEKL